MTGTKTKERLSTFDVDKEGLAKLLRQRKGGVSFAVAELIQNCWDEDSTTVDVVLERTKTPGVCRLSVVDDNPEGFADLRHAYTLFAESAKKSDPTKRGRFNLGEKLVIAIADSMVIRTTKGTVAFDRKGRTMSDERTERGTVIEARVRMSADEHRDACAAMRTLLVPKGIVTTFNGEALVERVPVTVIRAELATEKSDPNGYLRPTRRKGDVEVHEPLEGETPTIYEMGIPVVESGMPWHANVQQKVPLNFERNGVTPSYLRELSAVVANAMRERLDAENASERWAMRALEDDGIEPETVGAILDARFGEKRVTQAPNDREAEKIAVSQGYTVVMGSSLSKKAWETVRDTAPIPSAGKVTPSASALFNEQNPDAESRERVSEDKWTDGMRDVVRYTRALGSAVLGFEPEVGFINDATARVGAFYNHSQGIVFNVGRLSHAWFRPAELHVIALVLHEFAHDAHRDGGLDDHLDAHFADQVAMLGARLAVAAAADPSLVDPKAWKAVAADAQA